MDCPYPDCTERAPDAGAQSCPACSRMVKPCPRCGAGNRAFANFCRACGEALPEPEGEWRGFKGGVRRLGLNAARQAGPLRELALASVLELHLGDRCRSLLACDRHLIAVAANGTVEIADALRPQSRLRLAAGGPITCEPCASGGLLFLGAPGRIAAYSLGALALPQPRLAPLWEARLAGTPVQALTTFEDRLYATVARPDGRREVQVLEDLGAASTPRTLCSAERVSWLAADPASRRLLFLIEEQGEIRLCRVEHRGGPDGADASPPELTRAKVQRVPRPFAHHVPIAVFGGKVFGVFGEEEGLCRLDAGDGAFDQTLGRDVKAFSLSGLREGVEVSSAGISFLGTGAADALNHVERINASPVLLRDCAAVVGLLDGRLRLYDLQTPPRHETLLLSPRAEEVTAVLSFGRFVAAGDAAGGVFAFELAPAARRP